MLAHLLIFKSLTSKTIAPLPLRQVVETSSSLSYQIVTQWTNK
jgi:hypothetical protein